MFFLWRGLAHAQAGRVALLCMLGLHLMDHAMYLRVQATGTPVWLGDAQAVDQVVQWIESNLPNDGTIASSNPGLIYLRLGRKGVVNTFPDKNWEVWKRNGVRYVAAVRPSELPRKRLDWRMLFQTNGRLWVVEM
jgi:hypothetical protein